MTTTSTFDNLLATSKPGLRPIGTALREQILTLHGTAVEIVWMRQRIASFGVGPKKMSQHYAYISIHSAHVNLGLYHGAVLADPDGLLEGSGKRLRHIKIDSVACAQRVSVRKLLRQAILERRKVDAGT